jgi:hypothetical protein
MTKTAKLDAMHAAMDLAEDISAGKVDPAVWPTSRPRGRARGEQRCYAMVRLNNAYPLNNRPRSSRATEKPSGPTYPVLNKNFHSECTQCLPTRHAGSNQQSNALPIDVELRLADPRPRRRLRRIDPVAEVGGRQPLPHPEAHVNDVAGLLVTSLPGSIRCDRIVAVGVLRVDCQAPRRSRRCAHDSGGTPADDHNCGEGRAQQSPAVFHTQR